MAKCNYNFKLPGALHLRVECPLPLLESSAAKLLLAAYLPGVASLNSESPEAESLKSESEKRKLITVRLVQAEAKGLKIRSGCYTLSAPFDNSEAALMDLLFLCYGVARLHWLRQSLYAVHAACLEDQSGQLFLLAGHSGVGKTAVTLSLVGRGHTVFSGNKTLVKIAGGEIIAVAGTRTITTKAEDLERHLPQHRPAEGYQGRSAFTLPDSCYSSPARAEQQVVGKIFLPRLNDGREKCQQHGATSALHRLYPYFVDAVNADIVLLGGAAVLCGAPSRAVKERLTSALSLALSQTPTYELQGSIGYVTQTLEEI
ncbi:hypothetical protein BH11CYA1_BH11CYA1_23620 [soil metagenome]